MQTSGPIAKEILQRDLIKTVQKHLRKYNKNLQLSQHRVDGYNNIISYYTKTLFRSLLFIVNLISLPNMLMSSPVLHATTKNSIEFK